MRLTLIAAVAANGVIGRDNDLPWHIPEDLRRFRRLTMGHPILMGRHTHESILARRGRPLDGRLSVVVSTSMAAQAPAEARRDDGLAVVPDLPAALDLARATGAGEAFVIGGAGLYRASLPVADRLDLARIDIPVAGDVSFPDWEPADWVLVERRPGTTEVEIDSRKAGYAFEVWDRSTG
ncbi:dihydrofolate reductase [Marinibaculum pumilum]|uniref:Dihydrofolate reductase n=1 Tax=Marinibaculum pumilum TaxID=1766165 RepID=A0ABV7KZH6_9PROT